MRTPALVIFDMDDVLCDYDFAVRMAHMAAATGLSAQQVEDAIFTSGWDQQADEGRHDADAYLAGCVERLGVPLSEAQWLAARQASITPYADVLAMAARVADKTKIAMLTNNGPLLHKHFQVFFPEAADLFGDAAYFSGTLGLAKPEPAAFRAVAEKMSADPAEALFIDDTADYIEGATEAGLMTHHFRTAEELRTDLEARGLL